MAGKTGPNNPPGRKPVDNVRTLQRRLWVAAKRRPGRRFHALMDRIWRSDVLREGAACNDTNHAGESPVAAIARFGCVAVPDEGGGRPSPSEAQVKALAAVARWSGPTGGRAKSGAAAGSEHCKRRQDVPSESESGGEPSNCRALFLGRRPMGDDEGNGPVQSSSAPAQRWWHQVNGWWSKAGKVSESKSLGRKLQCSEVAGGPETGGSGRSSEDGTDNITDPEQRARGAAPCTTSEGRPDMPMANGK